MMCELQVITTDNTPLQPLNDFEIKFARVAENSDFVEAQISGSMYWSNNEYKLLVNKILGCMNDFPLTIKCGVNIVADGYGDLNGLSYNYDDYKIQIEKIVPVNFFRKLSQKWETPINLCAIPRNRKLYHKVRETTVVSGIDNYSYPNRINEKGIDLITWIYTCVSETFKKAGLESYLVSTPSQLSSLFSSNKLPFTTLSRNPFKTAIVFNVGDFINPLSTNTATGINEDELTVNEQAAVMLKYLLEQLWIGFRLKWYIDKNGKFKLEHESFFDNGYTYNTTPIEGIDLGKVESFNFSESYTNDFSECYGKVKFVMSKNRSLNQDDKCLPITTYVPYTTPLSGGWMGLTNGGWLEATNDYFAPELKGFEFGNFLFEGNHLLKKETGELAEKEITFDLFVSHYTAAYLQVPALDESDWIIFDAVLNESRGEGVYDIMFDRIEVDAFSEPIEVGGLPTWDIGINLANFQAVENGFFSASQIIRNFHKHNASSSLGIVNYIENPKSPLYLDVLDQPVYYQTPPKEIMGSVIRTKKHQTFKIPFNCDNFSIEFLNKFKNGRYFYIEEAKLTSSDMYLEINAYSVDKCISKELSIVIPDQVGGCKPRGTFLYEQVVTSEVVILGIATTITLKFKYYADGYCGSYVTVE